MLALDDTRSKFIYIGGDGTPHSGYKKTLLFDAVSNSWRETSNLNVGRRFISQMCFKHKLHSGRDVVIVIGGLTRPMEFLNSTEIYDIETETWTLGPLLPYAMEGSLVAKVDGAIFAIGGRGMLSGSTSNLGSVLEMDSMTLEWKVRPDLELNRRSSRVNGILYNV